LVDSVLGIEEMGHPLDISIPNVTNPGLVVPQSPGHEYAVLQVSPYIFSV